MNGFVKNYKITTSAVWIQTERKGKVKEAVIPIHGVVDVTHTKGDTTIKFREVTVETKSPQFKESEQARKFYREINNIWFGIEL